MLILAMWEEGNTANKLFLPVPPESFPFEAPGRAETIEILGAGERIVFGGEKLETFTIESFFPHIHDPSYVTASQYLPPYASIEKLKGWKNSDRAFRVYCKEANINTTVVIENLNYDKERHGHIGDVWYTLELKVYKPPIYSRVFLRATSTKPPKKKPTKKVTLPRSYTVKKGDQLGKIAVAYYGKADYLKIYNANKKLIDAENKKRKAKTKYAIYPGQKLTIPK